MTKIKGVQDIMKEAKAKGLDAEDAIETLIDSTYFHLLNKAYRQGVEVLEAEGELKKVPFSYGLLEDNPWDDIAKSSAVMVAVMLAGTSLEKLAEVCKLPKNEVQAIVAYAHLVACQYTADIQSRKEIFEEADQPIAEGNGAIH